VEAAHRLAPDVAAHDQIRKRGFSRKLFSSGDVIVGKSLQARHQSAGIDGRFGEIGNNPESAEKKNGNHGQGCNDDARESHVSSSGDYDVGAKVQFGFGLAGHP
jgi:hypothetical protein